MIADSPAPANTGVDGSGRPARLPELDGIRGMAMLLVLVWHYIACTSLAPPGTPGGYGIKALSMTWAGVDLFFVLSGYLIGGILIDNRASPNYFQAFYARRFCRIFPLYYLSLGLFAFAVNAEWGRKSPWLFDGPLPIWAYATYLQNFVMASSASLGSNWMGPTWSLAIEEQFYVVLPLAVRLLPPVTLRKLLTILVFSAPVLRGALFLWYPSGALAAYVLLPGRWDALFLGVLGAFAVRQPEARAWLITHRGRIRGAVVGGVVVTTWLLVNGQGVYSIGMTFYGHTVLAVMCLGLLLLASLGPGGFTRRLFSHPLLVWIGTISYGIYIVHQPMLGFAHAWLREQRPRIADSADAWITLVALLLTFAVATASWRFFERPIVQYGRRIRYDR